MANYTFLGGIVSVTSRLYFSDNQTELLDALHVGYYFNTVEFVQLLKVLGIIDNESHRGIVLPYCRYPEQKESLLKLIDCLFLYNDKARFVQYKLVNKDCSVYEYMKAGIITEFGRQWEVLGDRKRVSINGIMDSLCANLFLVEDTDKLFTIGSVLATNILPYTQPRQED